MHKFFFFDVYKTFKTLNLKILSNKRHMCFKAVMYITQIKPNIVGVVLSQLDTASVGQADV